MTQLKSLLADQGTTFTNFFVSNPLCCPSRASILRGQYIHSHQVLTNNPPSGGFQKFRALGHENSTVATWLKAAGYRTVLLGKYLNGYPAGEPTHIPSGWDEWYGVQHGHFFNYQINENGVIVNYGSQPEEYETDVLSRKAMDFIRRAAAANTPFFMYLAPYAPHQPATPAPRHQKEFASTTLPRFPSFNEEDTSDKSSRASLLPTRSPSQIDQLEQLYRKRLGSLLAVDEMLADLVKTLESTDILQNTFIFFTSDNGFHLGEHRLPSGKGTPYEEDIGVPLIVRGPGVPAARVLAHLATNVDLAPTFAELTGAAVPRFVDGRSLVPLLRSSAPQPERWRQSVLVEHEVFAGGKNRGFQALRTRDYLYVEWDNGERELYHLPTDPYQLQSLHATASPALLAQFATHLDQMRQCTAATCRAAEDQSFQITGQ